MNPQGIMTRIKTKLEESAYLKYVNQIEIGMRGALPGVNRYNLFLEPKTNTEGEAAEYAWPKIQPTFTIALLGYCNVQKVDKQVVGEGATKGILGFEEDVKKTLGPEKETTNNILGCEAINFWFGSTGYDFESWPVRGFELELIIQYRQDFITRA